MPLYLREMWGMDGKEPQFIVTPGVGAEHLWKPCGVTHILPRVPFPLLPITHAYSFSQSGCIQILPLPLTTSLCKLMSLCFSIFICKLVVTTILISKCCYMESRASPHNTLVQQYQWTTFSKTAVPEGCALTTQTHTPLSALSSFQ